MRKVLNLIGKTFGELTVLSRAGNVGGHPQWLCRCSCGGFKKTTSGQLRNGSVRSCGCLRKKQRVPDAALRRLYRSYVDGAKIRGYSFGLTVEQFKNITSSPCYYTRREPSSIFTTKQGNRYVYNGIDRLDNTKGYTVENCVSCCSDVNYAKGTMKYSDFICMCKEVANTQVIK
jgi:hypothetical protein